METEKDIVLVVDYHDKNLEFRWFDAATGQERTFRRQTQPEAIREVVGQAQAEAGPRGGRVVWIMESTTGWARVKELLADQVDFTLANVLQLPLPPKARRRKTDKLDTARLLREYLNGTLPLSAQPEPKWRQVRRLVAVREDLVSRRTALRNWISSYFAHESWSDRSNFWSVRGLRRLKQLVQQQHQSDAFVLSMKIEQLEQLQQHLRQAESRIAEVYRSWPQAQWLDEIRGIAEIAAVSILARIGPIERFSDAEQLISYAGFAPGVRQSDQSRQEGHIGGGGTDIQLRHYLIEATIWARQIPRYRRTYQRVEHKRGKKIGRLVVARLLLRSIYKMLSEGVRFDAVAANG